MKSRTVIKLFLLKVLFYLFAFWQLWGKKERKAEQITGADESWPQTPISCLLLENDPSFHRSRSCQPSTSILRSYPPLLSAVEFIFSWRHKVLKTLFVCSEHKRHQSSGNIRSQSFSQRRLCHSGDVINVYHSAPTRLPSGTIRSQLVSLPRLLPVMTVMLISDSNLPSNKPSSDVSVLISLWLRDDC